MPGLLDTALGSAASDTGGVTTIAFTTTAAVATGGFVVLGVTVADTTTLRSVSGGSLVWSIDHSGDTGLFNMYYVSAIAPAGLASSTTITATFAAGAAGRSIGGVSFLGMDKIELKGAFNPILTTPAWTTGNQTIKAGSVLLGFSVTDNGGFTSSVTSPSVEDTDVNGGAGTFSASLCHRIEYIAGSYAVAGTWSSTATGDVLPAAYSASTLAFDYSQFPRNELRY